MKFKKPSGQVAGLFFVLLSIGWFLAAPMFPPPPSVEAKRFAIVAMGIVGLIGISLLGSGRHTRKHSDDDPSRGH
jgi:membrane-associated phospholipid phosphatase